MKKIRRKSLPIKKQPKMNKKKGGSASPYKAAKRKTQKKGKLLGRPQNATSDRDTTSDSDSGPSTKISRGTTGKEPRNHCLRSKSQPPQGSYFELPQSASSGSDTKSDSDSGSSKTVSKSGTRVGPRKYCPKPKSSNKDKEKEQRSNKPKKVPSRVSITKPPVGQLKKTSKFFLRDDPSYEPTESESSDSDTISESDLSTSTIVSRKHYRLRKSSNSDKNKKKYSNKPKKEPSRASFSKSPLNQRKKTRKSFLQDDPSYEPPQSAGCKKLDSDVKASTTVSRGGTEEELRHSSRPKSSDNGEQQHTKKPEKEPSRVCFCKPPVGQLTSESCLQDGPCFELVQSENSSDSSENSDSSNYSDSDTTATISDTGTRKESRKCNQSPNSAKNNGEGPPPKKPRKEPLRVPFRKLQVGQLEKSGESFASGRHDFEILKKDKAEEQHPMKPKKESPLPQVPLHEPSADHLKNRDASFLQNGSCLEAAPASLKCRECILKANEESKNMTNIFCRFSDFRKLKYTKNGNLISAGFSSSETDALDVDNKLWLPDTANPPTDLNLETSKILLMQVGQHFCDLVAQEKEAHNAHISEDKTVAWKRVVGGVREMCDVCETTLFNYHWICKKCGFMVCLDCYKSCTNDPTRLSNDPDQYKNLKERTWLRCTNRALHKREHLMLTQIIANDCLLKLGKIVHEMRDLWSIEQFCSCPESNESILNKVECRKAVKRIMTEKLNKVKEEPNHAIDNAKDQKSSSFNASSKLEELLTKTKKEESSSSAEEDDPFSLRKLLYRPVTSTVFEKEEKTKSEINDYDPLLFGPKKYSCKPEKCVQNGKNELKHFVRRYNWQNKRQQQAQIRMATATSLLYPNIPHSWLCYGKVLRLTDPVCKDNNILFQEQWKQGQPVIVSNVSRLLDKNLWSPEAFSRDFGEEKNNLVNCLSGNVVPNQPMRKFWEGFENPSKRLKDYRGRPMLLKLKDWPPGEDFAEMLPLRFQDLMQALPLQEYTKRDGKLNLASRLPDCFVRPDLGPKMYNAYGKPLPANKGTTNLHLDISDAVNVMVYVGEPHEGDSDEHVKEALAAIDEAGCDFLTKRRVSEKSELPGALWHIYNACDADKIRDLLNKVTVERGEQLEPHTDPIHDQSGYLDGPLRERLFREYEVEGYAILQCQGDAIFIPAGAPHQVRNINNCIKVAEDFVSPENVAHCFHLTQEFRALSNTHTNHEDKLQIKNVIYHTVKDAVCTLGSLINKELGRRVVVLD